MLSVPLSRVDPEVLAGIAIPDQWRRPCWALLAGGDGADYTYSEADWRQLVTALRALADAHRIRWLVAGSRRTGTILPALLAAQNDGFIEDANMDPTAADSRLLAYLAAADKVFVTEDSMSMLSEAMGSGKPVFSIRPAHARPNVRYAAALRRFEAQGLIRRLAIERLAACEAPVFGEFKPAQVEAPTRWLARRLRDRLGQVSK